MRLITPSFILFNHRQHHHVSYKQVINNSIIDPSGRTITSPSSFTFLKNSDKDFFDDGIRGSESGGSYDESIEKFEMISLQDGEELSDDILSQLEEGQPNELAIMTTLKLILLALKAPC